MTSRHRKPANLLAKRMSTLTESLRGSHSSVHATDDRRCTEDPEGAWHAGIPSPQSCHEPAIRSWRRRGPRSRETRQLQLTPSGQLPIARGTATALPATAISCLSAFRDAGPLARAESLSCRRPKTSTMRNRRLCAPQPRLSQAILSLVPKFGVFKHLLAGHVCRRGLCSAIP
jgi:hypothetical protein